MNQWDSLHLFYAQPDQADRIILKLHELLDAIARNCSGLELRWFFIRYFDGGAHIRCRVAGLDAAQLARFEGELAEYLRQIGADQPSDWYEQTAQLLEESQIYSPGSVVRIAYQPEWQRYGGPVALPRNEALFCASTRVACQLLAVEDQRRTARAPSGLITKAAFDLMLMNVAVITDSPDQAVAFLRRYAASWAHFVSRPGSEDWREILDESRPVQPIPARDMLDRHQQFLSGKEPASTLTQFWGRLAASTFADLAAIAGAGQLVQPIDGQQVQGEGALSDCRSSIMASQIHMMNNRLGQFPRSEALIAWHLSQALRG